MTDITTETLPRTEGLRRDEMKEPDEVSAMLRLKALGWGSRRISAELGCSRTTVRRWLEQGEWRRPAPVSRAKGLDGLEAWVEERFRRHAGNADVVRQELAAEKGVAVSLRTVERAVAHLRRELRAEARATVRFGVRAWSAQPSLDRAQIRDLATGRFIANGDALLLLGPPGVGKTQVSMAAPGSMPRGSRRSSSASTR